MRNIAPVRTISLSAAAALSLLALTPTPALAQTTARSQPGSATEQAAARLAAIDVSDPLLEPVAPPKLVLRGWRPTLAILRSRSVNVALALEEVGRADGLARQALAQALPQATGSVLTQAAQNQAQLFIPAGGGGSASAPVVSTTFFQISASQPIFAPRTWFALGTARKNVHAARLNLDEQKRQVAAGAAAQIVAVVTGERLAEINRVGLRSALQTLELTRRRARLGMGTQLDVLNAEQDVELARSTLITGDETLRQARESLGLTLGSSEPYGVDPKISLNEVEATMRTACSPAAPSLRSDVEAARAQVQLAARNVTETKLAYVPTADARATAAYFPERDVTTWQVQGVLTIPIWDGGARYGAARVARASRRQAEERYQATLRTATNEARQALRAVTIAERARQIAERTRDLARETARLAHVAFEAGSATSFDLVDAARRRREAELTLAVREFELVRAKIAALLAAARCDL